MVEVLPNTHRQDRSFIGKHERFREGRLLRRKNPYVMNEGKFLEGTRRSRQELRIRRLRIAAISLQEQLGDMIAENLESFHANGADETCNRLVATSLSGEGTIFFVPVVGFSQIPFVLS